MRLHRHPGIKHRRHGITKRRRSDTRLRHHGMKRHHPKADLTNKTITIATAEER